MKRTIVSLVLFVLVSVGFAAGITSSRVAVAVGKDDVCAGLDAAAGSGSSCGAPAGSPTVEKTMATVIRIFSWIVGIASVIMVMVGGFQYVTSGGDSGKVTSAKNTIMYSLIGVVIVALAQTIVFFVLKKVG